ncbi:MAG: hypothetical protein Q4F97_03825 [Bacteroidales bacterium]|nr:hypothetical protein [Bacteroidales bacterium]
MIKQDYLMAMIESFFKAIARVLKFKSNLPKPEIEKQLDDIYSEFLKNNREFFLSNDLNGIISTFSSNDRMVKLNMLSEILYRELELFNLPERNKELALKLIDLYDYINENSKEYSIEREFRRSEIQKFIE